MVHSCVTIACVCGTAAVHKRPNVGIVASNNIASSAKVRILRWKAGFNMRLF